MWEVSRWRGVRGEDISDVGGVKMKGVREEEISDVGGVKVEPKFRLKLAEFPMESLSTNLPDPHRTRGSEVRWR